MKNEFKAYTPNLDETVTFGVEIEFCAPRILFCDEETHFAAKRQKIQDIIDSTVNARWLVKSDCSVESKDVNYVGDFELVSPVLTGKEGLEEVKKVINCLKNNGCMVNETCGLHVHIGIRSLCVDDFSGVYNHNLVEMKPFWGALCNMVRAYAEFERCFDLIADGNRRSNFYCKSIRNKMLSVVCCDKNNERLRDILHDSYDRYVKLNVGNAVSDHGTVEFRQMNGTLDADLAVAWIWLCQRFAHKAAVSPLKKLSGKRKFTDLLSYLQADRSDEKRGFCRDSDTKNYVDTLRRIAHQHAKEENINIKQAA